jgi:FRG domain
MVEYKPIQSFYDFRSVVHRYRSSSWVFRGVSDARYEIMPSIGRPPLSGKREQAIFRAFSRGAVAFVQVPSSGLEKLALAQHYGLPTRLLDWTENPLVAAYFACGGSLDADGAIYMLRLEKRVDETNVSLDPFKIDSLARYYPLHVTSRITAQRGLFSIHPEPCVPLELIDEGPIRLHRVLVPKSFKLKLKYDLSRFHVHSVSLFPDLSGLAQHLTWTYSNHDPYDDEREE